MEHANDNTIQVHCDGGYGIWWNWWLTQPPVVYYNLPISFDPSRILEKYFRMKFKLEELEEKVKQLEQKLDGQAK